MEIALLDVLAHVLCSLRARDFATLPCVSRACRDLVQASSGAAWRALALREFGDPFALPRARRPPARGCQWRQGFIERWRLHYSLRRAREGPVRAMEAIAEAIVEPLPGSVLASAALAWLWHPRGSAGPGDVLTARSLCHVVPACLEAGRSAETQEADVEASFGALLQAVRNLSVVVPARSRDACVAAVVEAWRAATLAAAAGARAGPSARRLAVLCALPPQQVAGLALASLPAAPSRLSVCVSSGHPGRCWLLDVCAEHSSCARVREMARVARPGLRELCLPAAVGALVAELAAMSEGCAGRATELGERLRKRGTAEALRVSELLGWDLLFRACCNSVASMVEGKSLDEISSALAVARNAAQTRVK
eukprot:m51a1_g11620 hypothetical protein (367) ;mRNA; r:29722-31034